MASAPQTAHAALPSLSILIQGMPSQEAPTHPQKPSADMSSPFESYQHHHNHQGHHLFMPKRAPAHSAPPSFEALEADSGTPTSSSYSMPSPISPRTTRCPSLTNRIYYSASSAITPPLPARKSSPSNGNRGSFSIANGNRDVLRYTHDRIGKPGYAPLLPSVYPGNIHAPSHASHHHHHDHGRHHHMQNHHDEKLSKHEKRRRNHLESEKKRRENIKSGMDALFQLVPACRDQQESKANILKKTRDYILELQSAVFAVEAECRRLAEEGKEIKRRTGMTAATTATTTAGTAAVPAGKSRSRL